MKVKKLIQNLSTFDPEADISCLYYNGGVLLKEKREIPLSMLYTDGSLCIPFGCLPVLGPHVFIQPFKLKRNPDLVVVE